MKKVSYRGSVRVNRRLIVADEGRDVSGFSWTLVTALGEMLLYAEEMFGPRDKNYTLLGIDFSPSGGCAWFPGDCGHIIIHLSMNCLRDRRDAYCQLAHECVHLLSPTGTADANVLEEGLAAYFEKWYMHRIFGEGWWSGEITIPDYANAFMKVEHLLAIDREVIKKIRQQQPVIARITAEQIREYCPGAPKELSESLTKRFSRE